jgi:hypothetical protein
MARLCAGVVLVALVLYILCGVATGLSFVREAVCDRISERLGVRVSAESSQFGLPFAMVLRDVKTDWYGSGVPGFMVETLRISPAGVGRWHVSCERGSLRLASSKDGSCEPAAFAALGLVPECGLSQVSVFTAEFCSRLTFDLSGLTVRWVRPDSEFAVASGVRLVVQPAEVAGRSMFHHELSVASVVGPGGVRASGVRREWLAGEGITYRELARQGGEQSGKGAFWEGTKQ